MNDERRYILRDDPIKRNLCAFISKQPVEPLMEVIVRPLKETRSGAANRRLWALHALASAVTGYSGEEMHEHALCRHFGYTEREVKDPFTGEITQKRIPNQRSSAQKKKQFAEFMESTETWYIQDFGVWLDREAA